MATSQPYTVACAGGLVKASNQIDLLKTPGVATDLRNFEVSIEGGYRRINGYSKLGSGSAALVSGSADTIHGVIPYGDGVVACASTGIYFSQDGTSWLNISRSSVDASGDNYSAFTGRSTLTRTGQGKISFSLFEGPTYDYGLLIICDGANEPYYFRMEGTGSNINTRTYFGGEITVTSTKFATYSEIHDKHLIVAGVEDNLSTVYYSTLLDPTTFNGTGSGSITLSDQIVGIKSFRNELFIFCRNSIFKLQDINGTAVVIPVAKNIGCLSGYSIQEIGGDLIFLAPDGLRTVAGTARIGDVELGTVSKAIQPILTQLAENIDKYIISSVVIREKSQYRLFYTNTSVINAQQEGIIGTLRPNGFEWSETRGIEVTSIGAGFNNDGVEKYFHGDTDGYVLVHDSGNDFNGSNILARYATPDYDYGDLGTLKTLHYVRVSCSAEGTVTPALQIKYDFNSQDIPQPTSDFSFGTVTSPAIFAEAVFNTNVFGGTAAPMIRIPVQGSGTSNNFTVVTEDTKAPYKINGLYIDFIPSGRR
tara:strand:+ start:51286 stop:52890 length:1605 start_codon:yes stop_codon:yes gene_type:complete